MIDSSGSYHRASTAATGARAGSEQRRRAQPRRIAYHLGCHPGFGRRRHRRNSLAKPARWNAITRSLPCHHLLVRSRIQAAAAIYVHSPTLAVDLLKNTAANRAQACPERGSPRDPRAW